MIPISHPFPGDAAAFERLLEGRFSCRSFKPEPVPRTTIEQILNLSQRTASWCNTQPWQVAIASGAAAQAFSKFLLEAAVAPPEKTDFTWPEEYRGVYRERRRECGLALYESVGITNADRAASTKQAMENFRFFGAPHVAIVTSDAALGTYGALDCGGWVANFMTAAWSLGVASIAQGTLASRPSVARAHFRLGPERLVVCGVSFGFANEENPANGFRTTRAPVAKAVSWHD